MAKTSFEDTTAGYMYCCQVQELRRHISYLPDLGDVALLADQDEGDNEAGDGSSDHCTIDLEELEGKHIPLFLKNGAFYYPTSTANGTNSLTVQNGEELTFGCHGSKQTFINDLEQSYITATCENGKFVTDNLILDAQTMSCSNKNEPKFNKIQSECASEGADGRTDDLSQLYEVEIGWEFDGNFKTQVCIIICKTQIKQKLWNI